jgi:hypothetical protein
MSNLWFNANSEKQVIDFKNENVGDVLESPVPPMNGWRPPLIGGVGAVKPDGPYRPTGFNEAMTRPLWDTDSGPLRKTGGIDPRERSDRFITIYA